MIECSRSATTGPPPLTNLDWRRTIFLPVLQNSGNCFPLRFVVPPVHPKSRPSIAACQIGL